MSVLLGLHNKSQCTDCTGGFYCETPGKTKVTGPCQQGHFCPTKSSSKTSEICPAGRYCPTQTQYPKECPLGTFSNRTGLWDKDQCTNCTAGWYCGSNGLTSPSGQCRAGYYCPEGSYADNAKPCVIGFHCPQGIFCSSCYYIVDMIPVGMHFFFGSQTFQEANNNNTTGVGQTIYTNNINQ